MTGQVRSRLLPAASLIWLLGLAALWQTRRDAATFSRPWAKLPH